MSAVAAGVIESLSGRNLTKALNCWNPDSDENPAA